MSNKTMPWLIHLCIRYAFMIAFALICVSACRFTPLFISILFLLSAVRTLPSGT